LWTRLERKGYPAEQIREAVADCKCNGYLDDRLFAALYVEQKRKPLGNARLTGELIKRGIDRAIAAAVVAQASHDEAQRIELAIERIFRRKADTSYPSAARALERLGFPASLIYRKLRVLAQQEFG
ncbi:MAG: RecX family transcriptional regulator, partial [Candidatus Eremiobacteraeota bacterium]|nr:RecX family transcriptional regulator [Candidatus Eremiobacteraeota bacterium]